MTQTGGAAISTVDAASIGASLDRIRRRRDVRRCVIAGLVGVPTVITFVTEPRLGCMDFAFAARVLFSTVFGVVAAPMLVAALVERRSDRAALAAGAGAALRHYRTQLDRAIRATRWRRLAWFVAGIVLVLADDVAAMQDGRWNLKDATPGLLLAALLNGVLLHRRFVLRPKLLREREAMEELPR